jgi:hypothetical protein
MKFLSLVFIILFFTFNHSLGSQSKAGVNSAPLFSSAYTDFKQCGSGLTPQQEKEAAEAGQDLPTICKGYGNYKVSINYSAWYSQITIESADGKGEVTFPPQNISFDKLERKLEWRLVDNRPFAVILRMDKYKPSDDDPYRAANKIGEILVVRGLKGYQNISTEIDTKKVPDANLAARRAADAGFQH